MKIAVVGTGISGLSAAWLLNNKHEITVYEQNDYIGGHSNTVEQAPHPAVDTGFIVYNEWTYPNLIALFDHLDVETIPTDMSFAVSIDQGRLEYSGDSLFAQKSNFFKPSYYKMLLDIVRFYKTSPEVLESSVNLSLGEYLKSEKYSQTFINDHLLPMGAAIWSMSAEDTARFPAKSFVRFFQNHGLLLLKDRPQWHTVNGGSREYVKKLIRSFEDKILLNTGVKSIQRHAGYVEVTDTTGKTEKYDHVVLASHSDQSLSMLSDASEDEKLILSSFPYTKNIAYLHQDETLMPKRKSAWASWNYLSSTGEGKVCVSYWMNKLQSFLPEDTNYFVTLNSPKPPEKEKIVRAIEYTHPQYTMDAINGWNKIHQIQGTNRTWFCGAWCGFGFHEDGLSSGLAVAEKLGDIKRPWSVKDKSPAGQNAINQ